MLSPLSSLANSNLLFLKTADFPAELETASSKYLHLVAKNQVFQQELLSMKLVQKKCKKLERRKKLEQEVVTLRSHTEVNMIEHGQVEQYQQESEERARQDIVEK